MGMYIGLSESERRDLARRSLDATEIWLRKILHQELTKAYGENYFHSGTKSGNAIIPKKIRERAEARMRNEADRFSAPSDALTFGDIVSVMLHPEHYDPHFKTALNAAYPDGCDEARTFLGRLEAHRNNIAHQGTCSVRALEQCVCYANDLIDSLKNYFAEQNMQRLYNVPMITRAVDNKGNEIRPPLHGREHIPWIVRDQGNGDLNVGDTLDIEIEIDESFPKDSYSVRWNTSAGDPSTPGLRFQILIELRHVADAFSIYCDIISNKPWHRMMGGIDDKLIALYRVLPPPE